MSVDRALADLEAFRDEHEHLVSSERRLREVLGMVSAEREALTERLDEALAEAERVRERVTAHFSEQLHQAHRKLAVAQDVNTRLSAQVAEMQEQVRQAERQAENSRRALLDHAGRM